MLANTVLANPGWFLRRLRSMSVQETAWRATRGVVSAVRPVWHAPASDVVPDWDAMLAGFRSGTDRPVFFDRGRVRRVAAAQPGHRSAVIAAADEAVRGRHRFFGYDAAQLAETVDWNLDAVSGFRWPSIDSSRIDYRNIQADVKWIWELNRLQHLSWLAQAWLLTGEQRYSHAAFDQLDSWLQQCPPGTGIAWRNAFEAGVRAVSVALSLQGFRDSPDLTTDRFRRIAQMLESSASMCWTDRSRFSSANNHLIGELAGLAVVAMLFPELPKAAVWEDRAVTLLTAEADRQILPDGAGAEQAVGYQVFSAELLMLVAVLLIERDGSAPSAILNAIDRSAGYLAAIVGKADPEPRYGDDDEGFAIRLDALQKRTVRDHLGCVAAITGNPAVRDSATRGWTSEWLSQTHPSAAGYSAAATDLATSGDNHFAPHGGLVVLRSSGIRTVMDVGPLGYLSIAAHGHADALAVTISLDGVEIVGDPGAGSYYGHPDWRRTHRGTRAHATVQVDGVDQSVAGGPFLWTRHAAVRVHGVDLTAGVVDAEHNGYRRLDDPVNHRRWLVAPADSCSVLVVDLLSGPGHHQVCTSWPIHPDFDVVAANGVHSVTRAGRPVAHLATAATAAPTLQQTRADQESALGWWSDHLESRRPAWLVGACCAADLPVVIATVFQPADALGSVHELQTTHVGAEIAVSWADSRERHQVVLNTTLPAAAVWTREVSRGSNVEVGQASTDLPH
jgi:hypothetical protein